MEFEGAKVDFYGGPSSSRSLSDGLRFARNIHGSFDADWAVIAWVSRSGDDDGVFRWGSSIHWGGGIVYPSGILCWGDVCGPEFWG